MIVPQGKVIGPAGLKPPAAARNRRKATVKNTKNRPIRCDVTRRTIPQIYLKGLLRVRKRDTQNNFTRQIRIHQTFSNLKETLPV